jgi:hypothetical protein
MIFPGGWRTREPEFAPRTNQVVGNRETKEERRTSMTRQADAHATVEGRIHEDQGEGLRAREEIEGLEELYATPAATFDEVEETEDEIVWFVVLIVFLLTLAATVAAGAAIYCWIKGGHLYTWYRISALKVKISCKF